MSKKWAFPGLSPSVTLEPVILEPRSGDRITIGAMPGRAILASLTEPYTCHPREGGDLHCKSPPQGVTIPNAKTIIFKKKGCLCSKIC